MKALFVKKLAVITVVTASLMIATTVAVAQLGAAPSAGKRDALVSTGKDSVKKNVKPESKKNAVKFKTLNPKKYGEVPVWAEKKFVLERKDNRAWGLFTTKAQCEKVFEMLAFGLKTQPKRKSLMDEIDFKNESMVAVFVDDVTTDVKIKSTSLTEKNGILTLEYTVSPKNPKATYTIHYYTALVIPKKKYKDVRFIEAGKLVHTLNVANGK